MKVESIENGTHITVEEKENDYSEFFKELCNQHLIFIANLKNVLKSKKVSRQYSVLITTDLTGSREMLTLEELIILIIEENIKEIILKK